MTVKRLKFSDPLPELVLRGLKDVTWRVDDDKDIAAGNALSLCRCDGNEFAKAEVVRVKETTFGRLSEEDKKGHEEFSSDLEMYETYSNYYDLRVTPETGVKVIKFKLV
jgi:hypothetical protein